MLVWKAMPSMTPMMSAILFDEASICRMVATTCAMTAPPRCATPDAVSASTCAWRALSAFCLTVEVSSSMEEAVSSSELACCSVRADRSRLPAATSDEAEAIVSVPARTVPTVCARLSFMRLSACNSCPISSRDCTVIWLRKSPAATVLATCSAVATGPVIERVMPYASAAAMASAASDMPISKVRVLAYVALALSPAVLARVFCKLICSAINCL
ncbi:hypothetical protein D3C71_286060 [compost metagenome]